jgi:hypothetical protein
MTENVGQKICNIWYVKHPTSKCHNRMGDADFTVNSAAPSCQTVNLFTIQTAEIKYLLINIVELFNWTHADD